VGTDLISGDPFTAGPFGSPLSGMEDLLLLRNAKQRVSTHPFDPSKVFGLLALAYRCSRRIPDQGTPTTYARYLRPRLVLSALDAKTLLCLLPETTSSGIGAIIAYIVDQCPSPSGIDDRNQSHNHKSLLPNNLVYQPQNFIHIKHHPTSYTSKNHQRLPQCSPAPTTSVDAEVDAMPQTDAATAALFSTFSLSAATALHPCHRPTDDPKPPTRH
jgi:hypothetical protein